MMSDFEAMRINVSYAMHLQASPDRVFPLLCPVREYEWIEPWECEVVYTQSGYAELGCIFKTNFPADVYPDVWVVSGYEPNEKIEFVRINAIRAMRFSIRLTDNGDETTTAIWEQIFTGLNPEGNELVKGITNEKYVEDRKLTELRLNHYLVKGEMLRSR
jgi:hypothetical protein